MISPHNYRKTLRVRAVQIMALQELVINSESCQMFLYKMRRGLRKTEFTFGEPAPRGWLRSCSLIAPTAITGPVSAAAEALRRSSIRMPLYYIGAERGA